ncbi:hypothetical protein RJ641_036809 [Dillenia turbinata]|uniref:Uncharacterized protein n=1 Tax=Dillenia turbinata TaxID=194707 RepID=A0AAN8ZGW3_9MAGN
MNVNLYEMDNLEAEAHKMKGQKKKLDHHEMMKSSPSKVLLEFVPGKNSTPLFDFWAIYLNFDVLYYMCDVIVDDVNW